MNGFLKIDHGNRHRGLILEFRKTFPAEWGSRTGFAWIRVSGITQNHLDEINRWKLKVKESAFTDKQKTFWLKAKAIHDAHRDDIKAWVASEAAAHVAKHGTNPSTRDVAEFGRIRDHIKIPDKIVEVKAQLKEFILPLIPVADLAPHIEQTPQHVWKQETGPGGVP